MIRQRLVVSCGCHLVLLQPESWQSAGSHETSARNVTFLVNGMFCWRHRDSTVPAQVRRLR